MCKGGKYKYVKIKQDCARAENASTKEASTSEQGQYYSTYSVLQYCNFSYSTVSHVNAHRQSLGPPIYFSYFIKFTCLFGCFVMSVSQRDSSMVGPSVDACANISTSLNICFGRFSVLPFSYAPSLLSVCNDHRVINRKFAQLQLICYRTVTSGSNLTPPSHAQLSKICCHLANTIEVEKHTSAYDFY